MSDGAAGGQTIALSTLIAPSEPWMADVSGEVDCYDMEGFGRAEPVTRAGSAAPNGARTVRPGDVLVSVRAHAPRRAWIVGESRGRPQIASPEWLVLRSAAIDAGFARHVLVSNEFELACRTVAPGGRRRRPAGHADLSGVTIVLPPKNVQAGVARVMDRADLLRANRAVVVERGRRLAQALFIEHFGTAPETAHPSAPLSSLLSEPPRRGVDVALDARGRFPVIRAADMYEGEVTLSDARYVSSSDAALARTALADGDLLLAREPGHAQVRLAIARPGDAVWFTHAKLWRLRANPAKATAEYLRAWFSSQPGQGSLVQAWMSSGTRVSVEQRIAGIALPVPAIEVQQRFAERLNAADRFAGRLHASAERLDALLATLRDLAFRGELKLASERSVTHDSARPLP